MSIATDPIVDLMNPAALSHWRRLSAAAARANVEVPEPWSTILARYCDMLGILDALREQHAASRDLQLKDVLAAQMPDVEASIAELEPEVMLMLNAAPPASGRQ